MATDIPAPADIAQSGQPAAPAGDGASPVQPTFTGGTQQQYQGSCPPVTPEDVNCQLPPNGKAAYMSG